MLEHVIHLTILFFVIFDPLASFAVFYAATSHLREKERARIALYAVLVALILSLTVIIFGQQFLILFNTTIQDFKVASGIILSILGIKMALGQSLTDMTTMKDKSSYGIAAIIGTPLLTGPAAITSIIVSVNDYGHIVTTSAIIIVLAITAVIFYLNTWIQKIIGDISIRVISTLLGLITVSWGVKFFREGFGL